MRLRTISVSMLACSECGRNFRGVGASASCKCIEEEGRTLSWQIEAGYILDGIVGAANEDLGVETALELGKTGN